MKIKNVWERLGRWWHIVLVLVIVIYLFTSNFLAKTERESSYHEKQWPRNDFSDSEGLRIPEQTGKISYGTATIAWTEGSIVRKTPTSTIDFKYPILLGANMRNVNAYVTERIAYQIEEDEKRVRQILADPEEYIFSVPEIYLVASYRVAGITGNILSFEILTTDWTGGGNGNHDYPWAINWDISKDNLINLNTILCPKADKVRLVKEINRQLTYDFLEAGYAGLEPNDADTATWIDEFTDLEQFQVTGEGIIFVFPPYQVTSGAAGTVRTLVSYSKLSGIICLPY